MYADLIGKKFLYEGTKCIVELAEENIGITCKNIKHKTLSICFVLPGSPKFKDQCEAWQKDSQELVDYVVDCIKNNREVKQATIIEIQKKYDPKVSSSYDGYISQSMCGFNG